MRTKWHLEEGLQKEQVVCGGLLVVGGVVRLVGCKHKQSVSNIPSLVEWCAWSACKHKQSVAVSNILGCARSGSLVCTKT